jgi:50S ribosomal subunit-associated GTPase HflX
MTKGRLIMARNKTDKAEVEEAAPIIEANPEAPEAQQEAVPISTLDKNRIAKINDIMTRRYGAHWSKA